MIKTLYAQAPLAQISKSQFVHRWRAHGALAMTLPSFWDPVVRYMQNDRLPGACSFSGANNPYIGVGEIYYANAGDRDISRQSSELKNIIHPDASQFFERSLSLYTGIEEVPLLHGRHAPIRIFVLATRGQGVSQQEFILQWEAANASFLQLSRRAHHARRITVGRPLNGDGNIDATFEACFDTSGEALAFHGDWLRHIIAAGHGLFDTNRLVVVPAFCALFYDKRLLDS